jgi:hypothetical protein
MNCSSVRNRPILILPPRAQTRLLDVGRLEIGGGPQMNLAGHSVDNQGVAVLDDLGDVGHVADGGDSERARDDGDVARRPRLFEHEAAQPRAVVIEQRGGAHGARDQDGVLRQFLRQKHEALPGELMQQPIGDVGEVMQAIAQVGVGLSL